MSDTELLNNIHNEVQDLNSTMRKISLALEEISTSLAHISGAFKDKKLYMCGEVTSYSQY